MATLNRIIVTYGVVSRIAKQVGVSPDWVSRCLQGAGDSALADKIRYEAIHTYGGKWTTVTK